jgi:hypothetical protein
MDTDMDRFIRAIPFAMLIGIGMWLLIHKPDPPPAAATLSGCFANNEAPPIRFANGWVYIQQKGSKPRRYKLAWEKWGPIVVDVEPSLVLRRSDRKGYSFAQGDPAGNESRLIHTVDGQTYGVLHGEEAEAIQIDDDAGQLVTLARVPSTSCYR